MSTGPDLLAQFAALEVATVSEFDDLLTRHFACTSASG